MSTYKFLRNLGLTNELFDFKDVQDRPTSQYYVYCSSQSCLRGTKSHSRKGVEVAVTTSDNRIKTCPRCSSSAYLFFQVQPLRKNAA